ncbi:hypothetical protein C8Q78DRAFT_1143544 [Trametes maxima]|nr:hypothetical protein C8Q78DRAFT_1143544 [Trametes maxima]
MSGSPALAQLSPGRSPSLSAAFPRSPCDTPSTPPASACISHAPPTPPDSSSRAAPNAASSPLSNPSPNTSSVLSLSSTLSASAPQFQSRLLDTPIDIHDLSSDVDSASASVQSLPPAADGEDAAIYHALEYGSPTPPQGASLRMVDPDGLPPAFVPATARALCAQEPALTEVVAPVEAQGQGPASQPPNVYINGLPPNFPEEDLLAMTRPFGNVLSVRTFTRHVSDKPSGYGFVLFERLDAAEKCIESLRKYRNLHPSFSKQVHKIPGTDYATAPSACNTGPADSFKAKMEQLRDTASTNLYMEGLPLCINEETLRALVTPYRIMSSRFFHTRLSSPPRIIAFVRLETRQAAEDIIERLHGRLVRGWNDAGCRISVRFADTAEQRELRRTERHTREDEQSPARLTMARAALLNLKGTQYQPNAQSPPLGNLPLASLQSPVSPSLGLALNNLALGQLGGQVSPLAGTSPLQSQEPFVHGSVGGPGLSALPSSSPTFDGLNAQLSHVRGQDLRLPLQVPSDSVNGLIEDDQAQLRLALLGLQGVRANAQHGYTPVEQLILQAHARQHARAPGAALANGRRLQVPAGSGLGGTTPSAREANRRLLDCLPQMSEDDFHATASLLQDPQGVVSAFPRGVEAAALGRLRESQIASLPLDLERQLNISGQQVRQRNHTLAGQIRGDGDEQSFHTRSSTLPSQYAGVRNLLDVNPLLYDSSASRTNLNAANNAQLHASIANGSRISGAAAKNIPHPSSINTHNTPRHTSLGNLGPSTQNTHTLFTSKSNINLPSAGSRSTHKVAPKVSTASSASRASGSDSAGTQGLQGVGGGGIPPAVCPSGIPEAMNQQGTDADDEGSPVVSPALTYSTRTPASLSPATPYSGFFSDGGDSFKGATLSSGSGKDAAESVRSGKGVGEEQKTNSQTA